MALDGAFLRVLANELEEAVQNARVEKISQPSKEEIIISLRFKGGSKKLLLSANADSPRIHFTDIALENPTSPPMFCMLLRKHLNTGRLVSITQNGMDRVLTLNFEAVNELGDLCTVRLIAEIMGRHSNIIMVNESDVVIDSIKRIPNELSSVRMILPGVTYRLPPPQDKLNLVSVGIEEIMARFNKTHAADGAKALMATIEGFSPLLTREIFYIATKGRDIAKEQLSDFYKVRLRDELLAIKAVLEGGERKYTVVTDDKAGLRDFTFVDVTQYGSSVQKTVYESASALLDVFYANRDRVSRMKQRSHDLLRLLINATERIAKKLALQKEELAQCQNRDELKTYGDLLNSNLYTLEKGMSEAVLENFYDENCKMIHIPLDIRKTPAQNAQHYYAEYRKAATAEEKLTELMEKSEQELIYLDSVFDAVSRTGGESELLEIRQELAEQGYIRASKLSSRDKQKTGKNKMLKAQPPLKYCSSDGFSILCGRNNKQNDQLSMKLANNHDMWLHTQGIPGSHVIIQSEGKEISVDSITEAACIAAYHSKGQSSAQVAVDYTLIRNVKKPNGAKPGMVIFTDYKTAYVTPDAELVEKLALKSALK